MIGGLILFYCSSENTNQKSNANLSGNSNTAELNFERKSVIHCDEELTNLFFCDYTVLIIGHAECNPCYLVKNAIDLPSDVHAHVFYLDILKSEKHKMVAQALRTSGFPAVYLIDGNYKIKSILRRTINLEAMLALSISQSKDVIEERLDEVDDDKIREMLSSSLQAVLALNSGKYEDVYKFASESLKYKSYFFNNWLLYTYYLHEHNLNQSNHFKSQALEHIDGVNAFVYQDLIEKLK